jgi:hypothetical protein
MVKCHPESDQIQRKKEDWLELVGSYQLSIIYNDINSVELHLLEPEDKHFSN